MLSPSPSIDVCCQSQHWQQWVSAFRICRVSSIGWMEDTVLGGGVKFCRGCVEEPGKPVALPDTGSFSTYAERAIGPWAGFTIGWLYWWFWVLVLPLEANVAGIILHAWFPVIPVCQAS